MSRTEAQTRQEIIDKELALAGWDVRDPSQVTQELDIDLRVAGVRYAEREPTTKYDNHQFADYGLLYHGVPIAVVEAKKTSKDPRVGKEQALQYSQNLQKIYGGDFPFIFFTNGNQIWFWEYDFYPPVQIYGYPTRDELEWMKQRREQRKPLLVELINTEIVGRDYQISAIRSVLEGIEKKSSKFLLVMATGTGKTRVATALFDVLIRARWARRVLFLVDRTALRDQALDAFKEYVPSEPIYPKKGDLELPRNRRVYVETYQSMLPMLQRNSSQANYISPFFFDLIIADESHRSIYNAYQEVLNYFHGLKVGLTATPTDRIDHDTFQLFDCQTGQPTFAYNFAEAINHRPPYLCDFEVLGIRSHFQVQGIRGNQLTEDDQDSLRNAGIDPDDVDFEGSDLEKRVTNSGTNEIIVREFMEESIKDDSGTLPGKSIFFCISKNHARRVEKIFNRLYPEHAGKLARVMISEDRYVHGDGGLIDQFKKNDFPRIAISVDMLDTGIDVPEVVNLVFAKPVYSFTKFWQMIGRGTRVLNDKIEKRKPWCKEKDKFLIIDCWENFQFFRINPRGREPGQQIALPVRLFRARIRQLTTAQQVNNLEVVESAKRELRNDIGLLPKGSVIVRDAAHQLATVEPDQFWTRLSANDLGFLNTHIAPLMRARSGEDFKAMQFELEIVNLVTAILENNTDSVQAMQQAIAEQVGRLSLKVNRVEAEQDLIEEVLHPSDWDITSTGWLNGVSKRLGPLMKYTDDEERDELLKLNLMDLTVTKEYIEFGPEHERLTTAAYREQVEQFIRDLERDNPVIQKIKAGHEVTVLEIRELAKLLEAQKLHITEDLLKKVYDHKTASFIQFIQHILGLKQLESWSDIVQREFDQFIKKHNTFTSLQIRFLQTLRTFILQNRRLSRDNLIDRPFTQLHPNGIRGVFRPAEVNEVIEFAERLVA